MNRSRALQLLQLSYPFTPEDLKTAFRRMAKVAHADAGGTDEAMREVLEAREYLTEHLKLAGPTSRASSWADTDSSADFMSGFAADLDRAFRQAAAAARAHRTYRTDQRKARERPTSYYGSEFEPKPKVDIRATPTRNRRNVFTPDTPAAMAARAKKHYELLKKFNLV